MVLKKIIMNNFLILQREIEILQTNEKVGQVKLC